jgi:hypothetical protein
LEKKFNDLAALKAQVRLLKEQLSIARRLDWIRRGIYEALDERGGQRLMHASAPPPPPDTNASLKVEIHQGGAVKIQAPAPTNSH